MESDSIIGFLSFDIICVIRAIRVTYKYKLDSELARLSTYGAQETVN